MEKIAHTMQCRLRLLSGVNSTVRALVRGCLVVTFGLGLISFGSGKDVWRKVETRYFTVLAQTDDREARDWARRLEQFRISMESLFPVDEAQLEPVTVLIFKRQKDFNPIKPHYFSNPYELLGVFQRARGRNIIGMAMDSDEEKMAAIIFHEATHWYFSARPHVNPTWVEEGMAEVFSTFHLDGNRAVFAGDNPGRYQTLKGYGFLFVRDVMNAPPNRVHSADGVQAGLFYAQAWLLMNYVLVDGELGGINALSLYLEKARSGMPLDVAFQDVFDLSYSELDQRLDRYYARTRFGEMTTPALPAETLLTGRDEEATDDDIESTQAFFLLQQGRTDEARPLLERVLQRNPMDPRSYEGLAELAEQQGDLAGRDHYYSEAVVRGSTNYLAHFYPLINRVGMFMNMEAAADSPNPMEVRKTVDALKQTIALRPTFFQAYEAMAGLMGCIVEPEPSDRTVLEAGIERFPGQPILVVGLAAYEMKTGRAVTAKGRLDSVLVADGDFRITNYARKLLLRLKAQVDMVWLERSVKQGDTDQAEKFMSRLRRAPLFPDERQRVNALINILSQQLNLDRARRALDDHEWSMAENWLKEAASDEMNADVATRHASLQAELQRQRPHKP